MLMRAATLLLFCALLAGPARAGEPAKGGAATGPVTAGFTLESDLERARRRAEEAALTRPDSCRPGGEDAPAPFNPRIMMAAPAVRGDRLVGYAFLRPEFVKGPGFDDEGVVRAQFHVFLDRLVRASHAQPLRLDADGRFDRTALEAEATAVAHALYGADVAASVCLAGQDVRPLRGG